MAKPRSDGITETEKRYAGYEVHDRNGAKIGKMDDLFVDENDRTEYPRVKMGLLGLRSTLIPWEMVWTNEERKRIEVSETKDGDGVEDAPTLR